MALDLAGAQRTLHAALGAPWITRGGGGCASLAVYDAGPRDGGGAPPVVLLHGFPEIAFSWRAQVAGLAAAGRRVLAPDQRGYGASERPHGAEAYGLRELTGDLVALLDEAGIARAIWVGHDWGGFVAWAMPLLHPGRTAGVVGLNTPFQPRGGRPPTEALAQRHGPEMYVLYFQAPGVADALFDANPERSLRRFLRRAAPGERPPGAGSRLALQKSFPGWDPAAEARSQLLSDGDLAVFVDAFTRSGFTGGLNWYRNLDRNWRERQGVADHVVAPALMITAELDAVLTPTMAQGMERWVPDLETHRVAGSGHWTQQEKPREVNALLLDWLDRRFPLG